MPKKWTHEEVKEYIERNGCKLLTKEFKNQKQKLEIECRCGNISLKTFDNFYRKKQYLCKKCTDRIKADALKLDFEEIRRKIESTGCELLSTNYQNTKTKLKIKCSCGNIFLKRIADFSQGQTRCNECAIKSIKNKQKFSNEYVNDLLSEYGCELLSDYINSGTNIKIKCSCGNTFLRTLDNFKKYPFCKECGYKQCGIKNSDPNITEEERRERAKDRHSNEYRKVILKALKRDNYKCKCCGGEEHLVVHHILSFKEYEECRADLFNLITLCEKCHKEYHACNGGFRSSEQTNLTTFENWLGKKLYL